MSTRREPAVTFAELDLAWSSGLLGYAERYDLLGFLEASDKRSAYLEQAHLVSQQLTSFLDGPPNRGLWRAQVAAVLLFHCDFRNYIRNAFPESGNALLLRDADSEALALAFAELIVAVYLLEQRNT